MCGILIRACRPTPCRAQRHHKTVMPFFLFAQAGLQYDAGQPWVCGIASNIGQLQEVVVWSALSCACLLYTHSGPSLKLLRQPSPAHEQLHVGRCACCCMLQEVGPLSLSATPKAAADQRPLTSALSSARTREKKPPTSRPAAPLDTEDFFKEFDLS